MDFVFRTSTASSAPCIHTICQAVLVRWWEAIVFWAHTNRGAEGSATTSLAQIRMVRRRPVSMALLSPVIGRFIWPEPYLGPTSSDTAHVGCGTAGSTGNVWKA